MRVRIDLARVLPFLTPEAAPPPTAAIIRSTGLRVEPTTIGELHAWIRTNRGLWVAKCSVAATIGQSHTVQLEVYAPEGTIHPATPVQSSQASPQGKPGTQLAVSSGASAYYYDYDATGHGTLRCCPDGQVAHTDPDGRVHCGHKGEAHETTPTLVEHNFDSG